MSNTRIIDDLDMPAAIRDSTIAWLNDSAATLGAGPIGEMVRYNQMGIDSSIVTTSRRLTNWVKKPNNYSAVGPVRGNIDTLSDSDIRDIIAANISATHGPTLEIIYLNNTDYDYGHFTRQVLQDRYSYDPNSNIFIYKDLELYLEDAKIHVAKIDEEESVILNGPGFRSGKTPFRDGDLTSTYVDEDIIVDPTYQFDFFSVVGVNNITQVTSTYITETIVETVVPPVEPETEPSTTIETELVVTSTDTVDNVVATGLIEQSLLSEETIEEVLTEDTTELDGVTTTVKTLVVVDTATFTCRYEVRDTFTDYFFSQNIDWETLSTEEIIDLVDSISDKDIRVQAAYTYEDSVGETVTVYTTLTYADTSYVEDAEGTVSFGTYMPNLYFKKNFKFVDKDKDAVLYKESVRYTKRLGLKYRDLQGEIKKADDQDKIPFAYMRFGINVRSTNKMDRTYLHAFFKKYFNYCDTDDLYPFDYAWETGVVYKLAGKTLNFEDNITRFNIEVVGIEYFRGNESIHPVGHISGGTKVDFDGASTGSSIFSQLLGRMQVYYIFRKQITADTYEEYRVINVKSVHLVEGKWAETGKEKEGSDVLIPMDFSALKSLGSFKVRENILYRSLHVEFLTYVVQKIKFYQRGFFKFLMFAVSVAVTVFTGGAGVTVASVLLASAVNIAIGIAIDIAIRLLVKYLDPKLAMAIAGAIAFIGIFKGITASMNAVGFSKAFTILVMKADQFVKISTKILREVGANEIRKFEVEKEAAKERMEKLKEYERENFANRGDTGLSYLDEDTPRYTTIIVGETMDAFIARTINPNPGLIVLDYISNSVEYSLALPTLQESINKMNTPTPEPQDKEL